VENLDQVLNPESTSFWNMVVAIVVLIASGFVARLVRRRLRKMMIGNNVDESASALLARVAGWTVIFFGMVLALSIMGVDMVPVALLFILVAAFLLFAGKGLIENWAAGLLLQARAPYQLGDQIETEGYCGFVKETNARSVLLQIGDGQMIHVPNVGVLTSPMVNRTGEDGLRRSALTFGVADDSDFDRVERIVTDAATSVEGVIRDPSAPSAWISSVDETGVNVELRFWHRYADRHSVRSAVTRMALAALDSAGVVMPYPTQKVIISDPRSPGDAPVSLDHSHG